MLSIATSSIIVPLERLDGPKNGPKGSRPGHPSHDWERFQAAKASLDELLDKPFIGSPLWPKSSGISWFSDDLADVSHEPDLWKELQKPKPLGSKTKAKTVLWRIRKALAHGNIFTCGQPEIQQIILLSQVAEGVYKFCFLAVAPAGFQIFLTNWLGFLRKLPLPAYVVPEIVEVASSQFAYAYPPSMR